MDTQIVIEWSTTEVINYRSTFTADGLYDLGIEREAISEVMDAARRGNFDPLHACMINSDRGIDVLSDYEAEEAEASRYVSDREISVISTSREGDDHG